MPIQNIQFDNQDNSPQERLANLVLMTQTALENFIYEPETENVYYPGARELMQEAWPSVVARFEPYAEQVRNADIDVLTHHGLTGKELDFKFAAITLIGDRFWELYEEAALPVLRRLVSKVLEVIDKVLKSLIEAVPGGGAISEYKDICESLISDDEVKD